MSSIDTSQIGLRTTVQKRLFQDVFGTVRSKWSKWAIMVVDEDSLKVISNVIGMYNLMEHKVTLVESLTKKRAPFLDQAVIYFLSPTLESVDLMIKDWENASDDLSPSGASSGHKQLYANAVFIFFLSAVSDEIISKIKKCRPLVKRVRCLNEVNMDFIAKEDRAYHLGISPIDVLRQLYVERGTSTLQDQISDKLVTICATLNEYPHIRYNQDSPLGQTLAMAFHQKMNTFVGQNPNWYYHGDLKHKTRDRSTLLILDRSEDPLSPLMHEFTYQAMVHDLLKIEDDKITYKADSNSDDSSGKVDKDVLLNDNDQLWMELRGKHIADVIQILSSRIRDIVQSNTGAASLEKGKNLSITQMGQVLKKMPEYREVMSKLSQHMHISHQCMDIFNKQDLLELSDLEQTLATGQDEDGRRPKLSELTQKIKDISVKLSTLSKLRLLAIFVVSQKSNLTDDQVNDLYQSCGLSETQIKILQNLELLGVRVGEDSGPQSKTAKLGNMLRGTRIATNTARADNESEYSSSRYTCALKTILEDMANDRLSVDQYPSILPLPPGKTGTAASVRTRTAGRWARQKNGTAGTKKTFTGGRQMVFVAGGLCYSELRCAQEVMGRGDKEVILGSTCFLNPKEYFQALRKCSTQGE